MHDHAYLGEAERLRRDGDGDRGEWSRGPDEAAAGNAAMVGVTVSAGASEVQTLTLAGSPTGGAFPLTGVRPDTNAAATATGLPWDCTSAQLQAGLDAVFGSGTTTAAGGPFPATPLTVTWRGSFANRPVALLRADASGLTGGTPPVSLTVARTTAGEGPYPASTAPNSYFSIQPQSVLGAEVSAGAGTLTATGPRIRAYNAGPAFPAIGSKVIVRRGAHRWWFCYR